MRANNPEFSMQEEINILSGLRDDSRRSLSHMHRSCMHEVFKYWMWQDVSYYSILYPTSKDALVALLFERLKTGCANYLKTKNLEAQLSQVYSLI